MKIEIQPLSLGTLERSPSSGTRLITQVVKCSTACIRAESGPLTIAEIAPARLLRTGKDSWYLRPNRCHNPIPSPASYCSPP